MTRRLIHVAIAVCAFALGAAGLQLSAQSPQTSRGGDVLDQLLVEVRGLRASMEVMASAGPRVQLALGRLQLQDQRVNAMIRRLETVRASVAASQLTIQQHNAEMKGLEEEMQAVAGDARAHSEQLLAEHRARIAPLMAELQRMQLEESALAADIAAEQSRWTEFNQKLEELERSLVRR
jgi:chromosome segregation ATPase